MNRRRRIKGTGREGAAAVETALMMPLLTLVTFGSIDIAQYINTGQVVANASREAARIACRATVTEVEEVDEAVVQYLADSMPQLSREQIEEATDVSVKIAFPDEDDEEGSDSIPGQDLTRVDSGDALSVVVSFDFSNVRWMQGPTYPLYEIRTICRRE